MERIARLALVTTLVAAPGCQSERLTTRAYRLNHPEADTAVINGTLDEEWQYHSVQSSSRVTGEGYAVVKTTPRAHAKIREGLAQQ